MDKLPRLQSASELIGDGAVVVIGGLSVNCAPMAVCRELVRAGRRDLELVAVVAGMSADWLIAGGCVRKLIMGLTAFEGLALHLASAAPPRAGPPASRNTASTR